MTQPTSSKRWPIFNDRPPLLVLCETKNMLRVVCNKVLHPLGGSGCTAGDMASEDVAAASRARELWFSATRPEDDDRGSCSESTRDSWWKVICERYSEPSRHHHNLDHLNHMAELLAEYADQLSNPRAVALALFFQYIEYDPKSQESEERCIEVFRKFAEEARIPTDSELYLSVTELIQLTKLHSTDEHKQEGMYGREDKHFFLDFDMCVLGSSPAEYKDYTEKVRQEYSFVPDAVYKSLRSKVLRSFLQIPNIFSTEPFRRKYEERAKNNIRAEIAELDT